MSQGRWQWRVRGNEASSDDEMFQSPCVLFTGGKGLVMTIAVVGGKPERLPDLSGMTSDLEKQKGEVSCETHAL
jgi:hypothetical protein